MRRSASSDSCVAGRLKFPACAVAATLAFAVAARADGPARRWVFTDVTRAAGLAEHLADALNHAVAWGDFDGDGRPDLFLGNFCDRTPRPGDRPLGSVANRLFRQIEGGRFVYVPMPAVETRGRTSGAVFADLDNDGLPELYVANNTHAKASNVQARNEPSALYRSADGRFVNIGPQCGACPAGGAFGRDVGVFDFDADGLLDLLVLEDKVFRPKGRSRLYRNLGGLRFEDVTARAGLPEDLDGFGLAVADLNDDGLPDFYVCGPNRLFLSGPAGRYREAEALRPVFDIRSTDAEEYVTGAAFGDINGDGLFDLIVGTHFIPSRVRVYLNEGLKDGVPRFRDVTRDLGIPALANKAPTCAIEDFDNDGVPDLYWSAWFAEGAEREPFICRGLGVKDGLPRFAVPSLEGLDPRRARQNAAPDSGRGMVYYVDGPPIDYDGDGRLDFMAGAWPQEGSHLYRNETPACGHWLQVSVVGSRMNRMGIGAKVTVLADGRPIARREISVNGGYSGTTWPVVHFGLGQRQTVDLMVVFQGRREPMKLSGIRADQRLVVREPSP